MNKHFNIYCDESCHLEHDQQKVMVIGSIWCPKEKAHEIINEIKKMKVDYFGKSRVETKWVKVSPGGIDFYKSLVDYFFINPDLNFRAIYLPDKNVLDHAAHNQTHEDFYYKFAYLMLKYIIERDQNSGYHIFTDIKDTYSALRCNELKRILRVKFKDTNCQKIMEIQPVESERIELIQLADLFIGALSYKLRRLETSMAKTSLIDHIETHLNGHKIDDRSSISNTKFNIFDWEANYYDGFSFIGM